MKVSSSKFIRIRDNNEYNMDVESFIKSVEAQYKIDFRSLPNWKYLVQRLHVTTTDCKRIIQDANIRKSHIIKKLYMEWTKPSPFELTDSLARTRMRWCNKQRKKTEYTAKLETVSTPAISKEMSENISETAHPNSEIVLSEVSSEPIKCSDDIVANKQVVEQQNVPVNSLPAVIFTNQHKLLSPLGSHYSSLTYQTVPNFDMTLQSDEKEWTTLDQTSAIIPSVKEIMVTNRSHKEQIVHLLLTNISTEYLYIRFQCVTDKHWFKTIQIKPVNTIKLYPGLSVSYNFKFKLSKIEDDINNTYLFFKVGQNMVNESTTKALLIPIVSPFVKFTVKFTETVQIPPAYLWQINYGYPIGYLKVYATYDQSYTLRIVKRVVDLSRESVNTVPSLEPLPPSAESLQDRNEDEDVVMQSKMWCPSKGEYLDDDEQSIKTIDVIASIVEDLVEFSLETIVFESTYMNLKPYTKYRIPVHFPKPEHVGVHQYYYDLEFCDCTEHVIITKTIKVFAEVLPNPIQIYPCILDMSQSPITHGFCEDRIIITNSHKLYPVTVKFKLTKKMKKLFSINPDETIVLPKSYFHFTVRLCSREANTKNLDDLVHFTIKVMIIGDKSVYDKVPPFFYEIIAPCASDFKKIYNEKYFVDISNGIIIDDSKNINDL